MRNGCEWVHTPVPKLHLLTHLEAFLQIAHVEPERDMRPEQLAAMHRRELRFETQLALRRYAVALALNGRPEPLGQLGSGAVFQAKCFIDARC